MQNAEQNRRNNRRSLLIILGIGVLSLLLMFADFLWTRSRARRHEQIDKHNKGTNMPVSIPKYTNHE